jgi:hypothetical protein
MLIPSWHLAIDIEELLIWFAPVDWGMAIKDLNINKILDPGFI